MKKSSVVVDIVTAGQQVHSIVQYDDYVLSGLLNSSKIQLSCDVLLFLRFWNKKYCCTDKTKNLKYPKIFIKWTGRVNKKKLANKNKK